jgi:adenylate cyclase
MIDPFFNPSWVQEKLGFAHFTAKRYAEAVKHFQQGGRLRFHMHAMLAAAYARQDRREMAVAQLTHARAMRPDLRASHVLRLLRYERPDDRVHLVDSLAMAGLD